MFEREIVTSLVQRLEEPRRFMQILIGARQTGKSTAMRQVLDTLQMPHVHFSFDRPSDATLPKLEEVWQQARALCAETAPVVLALDELQRVEGWAQTVKALWDEDSYAGRDLHVFATGSSALMLRAGYSESLAGRFELHRSTHWNYAECMQAFGYDLEEFLAFGGFPGAAPLRGDATRWRSYLIESIVNATLDRDILEMTDVRKPALIHALFDLGAAFSSQELSYRKILGQLDDRGNTATIATYLELLSGAGLITGLKKYDSRLLASRSSSPRLLVHDTALMVVASGRSGAEILADPEQRGHLVETAIGAYLLERSHSEGFELFWWRDGAREVDFVVRAGNKRTAIEVKSGRAKRTGGMGAFVERFPGTYSLTLGAGAIGIEDFLLGRVPLFQ